MCKTIFPKFPTLSRIYSLDTSLCFLQAPYIDSNYHSTVKSVCDNWSIHPLHLCELLRFAKSTNGIQINDYPTCSLDTIILLLSDLDTLYAMPDKNSIYNMGVDYLIDFFTEIYKYKLIDNRSDSRYLYAFMRNCRTFVRYNINFSLAIPLEKFNFTFEPVDVYITFGVRKDNEYPLISLYNFQQELFKVRRLWDGVEDFKFEFRDYARIISDLICVMASHTSDEAFRNHFKNGYLDKYILTSKTLFEDDTAKCNKPFIKIIDDLVNLSSNYVYHGDHTTPTTLFYSELPPLKTELESRVSMYLEQRSKDDYDFTVCVRRAPIDLINEIVYA